MIVDTTLEALAEINEPPTFHQRNLIALKTLVQTDAALLLTMGQLRASGTTILDLTEAIVALETGLAYNLQRMVDVTTEVSADYDNDVLSASDEG